MRVLGNERKRVSEAPKIIQCKAFWTEPKNRMKAMKAPGRPRGRPVGGWIYDLVGLGKAINLVKKCQHKFNAISVGYSLYPEVTGYDYCISDCDDCKESYAKCNTFLKTNLRG